MDHPDAMPEPAKRNGPIKPAEPAPLSIASDPAPDPVREPLASEPQAAPAAPPPALRLRADAIHEDRKVVKGAKDRHQDEVTDVFVSTDQFIIYTASSRAGDRGRLRYVLPDDYETAKSMRSKLMPIVGDLAHVGDVIAGLPTGGFLGMHSQYATLRQRTLDLMARAMQAAFEDQSNAAATLIARARDEVISRRDSRNRMRYIFANSVALLVILTLWVSGGFLGFELPAQLLAAHSVSPGQFAAADAVGPTFRAIDVLVVGAIGAFFAVSAAINDVKVHHTISVWEMIYAGFVRVPIGVIAAAVVIFLISGGWILASIAEPYRLPSLYLFGFLAGFSELFVPNALKQVEDGTKAKPPGSTAGSNPT